MNVVISRRADASVIVRYEIHLAGDSAPPPESAYFDRAWQRAVDDGLVDGDDRLGYTFKLQLPTTLYESSQ